MYSSFFKRFIDVFISCMLFLAVLPLLILLSVLIYSTSGGPVFFLQERVGKNKKIFNVYKFRTMIINADKLGPLSTSVGDERITPIGKFLRRYSLDELPQILNVLKGDMSLIGYRPGVLGNYTDSHLESEVFNTRPGITGLAQVSGRSGLTPQRKRELELQYARNITFFGDLKIAFYTFIRVLGARGAY